MKVANESGQSLHSLYQRPNPAVPGTLYTTHFLREQWTSEKNNPTTKDQVQQKLQLELGRLLCLKERLNSLWWVFYYL